MSTTETEAPAKYDSAWDDPLPHTFSPTNFYLSPLKQGQTKAVCIFMHGRSDNIDDMVSVFLPHLSKRYGGVEGKIPEEDDDEDEDEKEQKSVKASSKQYESCKVAVIGIEATDYIWYPESHNAIIDHLTLHNGPYQYASLNKIRQTILSACETTSLSLDKIILIGFSQGGILSNTYLQAGLDGIAKKEQLIPLPGHILALAGSLFKRVPSFPIRHYASEDHEKQEASPLQQKQLEKRVKALTQPSKITSRLISGTRDQFFSQAEIEEAAGSISLKARPVKDTIDVQISVLMEPGAPHLITNRMIAATIEAIDTVLES